MVNEETRKKILNAPKRIKKIESMLEKHESDKEATDNLIYQVGKSLNYVHDVWMYVCMRYICLRCKYVQNISELLLLY